MFRLLLDDNANGSMLDSFIIYCKLIKHARVVNLDYFSTNFYTLLENNTIKHILSLFSLYMSNKSKTNLGDIGSVHRNTINHIMNNKMCLIDKNNIMSFIVELALHWEYKIKQAIKLNFKRRTSYHSILTTFRTKGKLTSFEQLIIWFRKVKRMFLSLKGS